MLAVVETVQALLSTFEEQEVQFRLTYEGPLAGGERGHIRKIKHRIRRAIHPQLRDLCAREPALHELTRNTAD